MTALSKPFLIVDNDPSFLAQASAWLESAGHTANTCQNPEKVLELIEQNGSIVIIIKLENSCADKNKNHEYSRIALLKAIRAHSVSNPVLIVSRDCDAADVAEALRFGAADFLLQPALDKDVFMHAINRTLELQKLHEEKESYRIQLEEANRELREHVRVLERDQQAARQVQLNLLPQSPMRFGDININHRVMPSLYLSGDFVDYGLLHNRFLPFYLTDVSGHGASSAFVTVWLKQMVRRLFENRRVFSDPNNLESDLATLLGIINREFMKSRFFCHLTCFVGLIDTLTDELLYILAGHLPMPILYTSGRAEYLAGSGKAVGIFEDADWEVNRRKLPKNFNLLVFSDGILEVIDALDLSSKEDELLALVETSSANIEVLSESLNLPSRDAVPDDIAILSLEAVDSKDMEYE